MAGLLSLQDLAALLSTCVGYVGNDSGPTHVAAALGTPCVALFGPGMSVVMGLVVPALFGLFGIRWSVRPAT